MYGKTSIDPRSVRMHLISVFDALMKNQNGFDQHEAPERQIKKFLKGSSTEDLIVSAQAKWWM